MVHHILDTTISVHCFHLLEIDTLNSVIRWFLDVQDSGNTLLVDTLNILLRFWMGSLIDVGVTDLVNEESSDEITICLANSTVHNPNNISVLPVRRLLDTELASVSMWVLDLDASFGLSFPPCLRILRSSFTISVS